MPAATSTVTDPDGGARSDRTEICADLVGGRPRIRLRSGLLRAQRLHAPDGLVRIALVATTALLLGGDQVDVVVELGPGVRLELVEVAGTVAYHGRGRRAGWQLGASVGADAQLMLTGAPFVVADGADVERSTRLCLDGSASATIRESLVLGRLGERGGRLRNRTSIRRGGAELLEEDQLLEPGTRTLPGLLGAHRVIDTITTLGADSPHRTGPEGSLPGVATFRLLDDAGTVHRWIGDQLADSPLSGRSAAGDQRTR